MFTSHSFLSGVSHAYTPAHMAQVEIITMFHNICYKKQYVFSIPEKEVQVGATAGERQGHCMDRSERLGAATAVAVRKEFLCSSRTTGFLGVTRSQQ